MDVRKLKDPLPYQRCACFLHRNILFKAFGRPIFHLSSATLVNSSNKDECLFIFCHFYAKVILCSVSMLLLIFHLQGIKRFTKKAV
jgi:hypothetical protein